MPAQQFHPLAYLEARIRGVHHEHIHAYPAHNGHIMALRVGLTSAVAKGPRNTVCVANREGGNKALVGGGVGAAVANTLSSRDFTKLAQGRSHLNYWLQLLGIARDKGCTH